MSVQAMNWAFEESGVTTNAQWSVLVVLANRADEDNTCWPGQEKIARESRQSVRTVRAALAALEEAGLISRQERRRPSDNMRTSDRYTLHLEKKSPATVALDPKESPANNAEVTGKKRTESPATVASQEALRKNLSEEPSGEPSPANNRKTTAPDIFRVTDQMRAYAALMAPSVELVTETEMFLGYHRSNGSRFSNWYAAWQKWVVKAHTWNVEKGWKPPVRIERVF